MAHVINKELCLACGACAGTCPVEAIAADGDVFAINPDVCLDCGACASECPVEAISEE
jgi:NAD-dependent dihydropyrimidine dehydrogenase PreA subunit